MKKRNFVPFFLNGIAAKSSGCSPFSRASGRSFLSVGRDVQTQFFMGHFIWLMTSKVARLYCVLICLIGWFCIVPQCATAQGPEAPLEQPPAPSHGPLAGSGRLLSRAASPLPDRRTASRGPAAPRAAAVRAAPSRPFASDRSCSTAPATALPFWRPTQVPSPTTGWTRADWAQHLTSNSAIDGLPLYQGLARFFTPGKSELFPFDQGTLAAYQSLLKQNPNY